MLTKSSSVKAVQRKSTYGEDGQIQTEIPEFSQ